MNAINKSKLVVIACLVIPILIATIAYYSSKTSNEEVVQEMRQVIAEKGGTIQKIDVVPLKESPFEKSEKGNTIYKITYQQNGKNMTAWYRSINHSSIKREEAAWKFDK